MRPKTKAFLDKVISDPKIDQGDAWIATHKTINKKSATATASEILAKPSSQIYLKEHVRMAKENMVEIANDKSIKPDTRIKALQDILDRNLGKAIARTEVNSTNLNLNIQADTKLSEDFTAFLKQKTGSSTSES